MIKLKNILNESVNEAPMELNKIKDAILMFQKKIEKQGRVTNARDEEHLKNLIKLYIQMGGKGVKESVNEGPDHDMFKALNKVNNDIFKIMNKYDGKVNMDAIFRSWMLGLHANLKKAGIKL